MSPAADAAFSRSLQSVSEQELEGAVKADVRQRGLVAGCALQERRPEAQEAEIGLFGSGAGQAAKAAVEQLLGIGGQVARKGRNFGLAIEGLAIGGLAGRGRADDGRQLLAATRDLRLARGAHRR